MMRDCCGSNDHPDSNLFIQMYRLVSTYSLIKPPKGSNISGGEILNELIKLKDIKDIDERWDKWTEKIDSLIDKGVRCDQLLDAVTLLEDHDYFKCSTSDYVLAYISGYIARKALRFIRYGSKTACSDCERSLQLNSTEEIPKCYKLINLKSYNYLKHPSRVLFNLISLLEKGTLTAIHNTEINAETLFDVMNVIEALPSTPLVGCPKHESLLTRRIIIFFLATRMYFICKQANKNDSFERDKTRERRKLAKLTYTSKQSVDDSCSGDISHNFKLQQIEIAMKPMRKRKVKALEDITNKVVEKSAKKQKISVKSTCPRRAEPVEKIKNKENKSSDLNLIQSLKQNKHKTKN